jgi:hypothetical protein
MIPSAVAQRSRKLPPGWSLQVDDQSSYSAAYQSGPGTIYLENDSPGRLSLRYSGRIRPGRYRFEARVKLDGNAPLVGGTFAGSVLRAEVRKDGVTFSSPVTIKSGADPVLILTIHSAGKIWGHLSEVKLASDDAISSASAKPSLEGSWGSAGEGLFFGPIGPEGTGQVKGLNQVVEYEVHWSHKNPRAFDLVMHYDDDPGIPPSYSGVLSSDGTVLHLTVTPSKRLPGPLPPSTSVYHRSDARP